MNKSREECKSCKYKKNCIYKIKNCKEFGYNKMLKEYSTK